MARKTRARRTVRGTSSVIEQSLRDAQKVLSGYMESGGRHVKDTLGSLVKIFENQHLSEALASGSRHLSRAVRGRPSAKRRPSASRGRVAKVNVGKRAAKTRSATKSRTAAAHASSAKRTGRTTRRK